PAGHTTAERRPGAVPVDLPGTRRCDEQPLVAAGAESVYRPRADRTPRRQCGAQPAAPPLPAIHLGSGNRDEWGVRLPGAPGEGRTAYGGWVHRAHRLRVVRGRAPE